MTGADEPTTRGDFPGGFPGDKRNAFSKTGRSREENGLFDYIRELNRLHVEVEQLKEGTLSNLYVSPQQYVYARQTKSSAVVVAINNDTKAAAFGFDIS